MQPTDIRNPDYFHKVVDCQWACPAHTPVPEYIRLIAAGRYSDAYMVNWKSNVFPGVLGRTCDRPCEPACRRGRVEEEQSAKPEPVAICRLKRVAADFKDDITHLLPVGLKGLVTAAMLAAAMQTCSAALNSAATLFSYDIWKRWKPATTDHQLVHIGRVTTVVATVVAIVLSPIFGHYSTIIQGLNTLICYIAPPITAVFLVGVFWRKAGGRGAFITMVTGGAMGLACFILDFYRAKFVGTGDAATAAIAASPLYGFIYNFALKDFMLTSFGMFVILLLVQIAATLVLREPLKAEANGLCWENWMEPLKAKCGSGLSDYRVMSGAVLVTFVVLYWLFW